MIDIAAIFGSKALDENKLLACGFERADGGRFSRTLQILDYEYTEAVHFSNSGEPSSRVFDGDGEEYLLASVCDVTGTFCTRDVALLRMEWRHDVTQLRLRW